MSRGTRAVVLDVPVDPVTVDELHDAILHFVRRSARATILHANVHAINLANRYDWFRRAFQRADLVFCDGAGVMLGARLLGYRIPTRITYADWTWQLAAWCERQQLSLFLLGGRPGVADQAAARLVARFPRLRIVGTHHGFFEKTAAHPDNDAVIATIAGARPDILMVGFGMPLQERWVSEYRAAIEAAVVLTSGAAFDYVSGQLRRAPTWMTSRGLEWFGRLIIEPRRLFGRYVFGNPLFLARIVRQRLRSRFRRRHGGGRP
jgi:N-acetylglucosaminyldiphosphoundecaprenol N-acetyl-beta-D-mannosaminyltransferase